MKKFRLIGAETDFETDDPGQVLAGLEGLKVSAPGDEASLLVRHYEGEQPVETPFRDTPAILEEVLKRSVSPGSIDKTATVRVLQGVGHMKPKL
jgi:hypothetical protein